MSIERLGNWFNVIKLVGVRVGVRLKVDLFCFKVWVVKYDIMLY